MLLEKSGEGLNLADYVSTEFLQRAKGRNDFLDRFSCIKGAAEGVQSSMAEMEKQLRVYVCRQDVKSAAYFEEAVRLFFFLSSTDVHRKFLSTLSNSELQDKVLDNLPLNLEHLDLSGCKWVEDYNVERILKYHSLKILNLGHCSQISNQAVKGLGNLEQLEVLSLRGCTQLKSAIISPLSSLRCLRELDLSNGPKLELEDVRILERGMDRKVNVKFDPLYVYLMDPKVSLPGGGFMLLYYSVRQGMMA
ncbi:MAG: hypothetical protein ACI9S8_000858 [Chlamydiales bacterium]|jgi:hypothetical protein